MDNYTKFTELYVLILSVTAQKSTESVNETDFKQVTEPLDKDY